MQRHFEIPATWLKPLGEVGFTQLVLGARQLEHPLLLSLGDPARLQPLGQEWNQALELAITSLARGGVAGCVSEFKEHAEVARAWIGMANSESLQAAQNAVIAAISIPFSSNAIAIWSNAIEYTDLQHLEPAFCERINTDGLLKITDDVKFDKAGIQLPSRFIAWHRLLPGMTTLPESSELCGSLLGIARGTVGKVWIAPDPFRVLANRSSSPGVIKNFVRGRPLHHADIGNLFKTGVTVYEPPGLESRLPEAGHCFVYGIVRLDIRWTANRKEGYKTLEIEEVISKGPRAGRYLHAEFDDGTKTIRHIDGAIMFYSKEDAIRRVCTVWPEHGKPVKAKWKPKLFRVDGDLMSFADCCVLIRQFFDGNPLIDEFLSGSVEAY